ncbi:hypothetical protein Ciccas_002388 [Cichlidogyrus casuarinus]|uniref:Uncharacterized protein n=1 Tax=Cichlidogyrus casuarinus TaxID=1844966 RepID=A0ABD2QHC4_9PLAT
MVVLFFVITRQFIEFFITSLGFLSSQFSTEDFTMACIKVYPEKNEDPGGLHYYINEPYDYSGFFGTPHCDHNRRNWIAASW